MLTAVQRIDRMAPPASRLASSGPADIVRVQRHKIAMWRCRLRRDRWLADSPLERDGFEPLVPREHDRKNSEPRCKPRNISGAPRLASLCAKRSRAKAAYAAAVPGGGSNGSPPRSRPR